MREDFSLKFYQSSSLCVVPIHWKRFMSANKLWSTSVAPTDGCSHMTQVPRISKSYDYAGIIPEINGRTEHQPGQIFAILRCAERDVPELARDARLQRIG
jgi:hypothetical protein